MNTNVDDLLYGYHPDGEACVKDVLEHFSIGKEEIAKFRYCGKEITQFKDFSIKVTATDNTEKIKPVCFDKRKRNIDKSRRVDANTLSCRFISMGGKASQIRLKLSCI